MGRDPWSLDSTARYFQVLALRWKKFVRPSSEFDSDHVRHYSTTAVCGSNGKKADSQEVSVDVWLTPSCLRVQHSFLPFEMVCDDPDCQGMDSPPQSANAPRSPEALGDLA